MIQAPPQEKEWISWLYVIIFSLIIFITIPYARIIERFISRFFDGSMFIYFVLAVVSVAFITSIFYVRRRNHKTGGSRLWLFVVAIIFIGYTIHLRKIPVEAIHFLEFGMVSILLYRALSHRIHDYSIYFAAAIIGGIIGALDETIQWVTPGRYWELSDIWINVLAASLVQVGIAKGIRPALISGYPDGRSLARICRLAIVAVMFLGASLLNTPDRIAWYANRIPSLAFLVKNESAMLEYGYLYKDPEIGIFRSRLSPEELKQTDAIRAEEASEVLDRFRDKEGYIEFLKLYTMATDPFLHEARVHLFRRDRYYKNARENKDHQDRYVENFTIASCENLILEKYFPQTLHHSSYVWTEELSAMAQKKCLLDGSYESPVSGNLFTRINEFQNACIILTLIIGLILLQFYFIYLDKRNRNKDR